MKERQFYAFQLKQPYRESTGLQVPEKFNATKKRKP